MRSASPDLSPQTHLSGPPASAPAIAPSSSPLELDRAAQSGLLEPGALDLQLLLGQFRSNYPMGSLSADLLAIQADQYIVRANIHAGGTLLATAMAAEPSLELAEDRARLRALELIGITATSAMAFAQQNYWPYAAQVTASGNAPGLAQSSPAANQLTGLNNPILEAAYAPPPSQQPAAPSPHPPPSGCPRAS